MPGGGVKGTSSDRRKWRKGLGATIPAEAVPGARWGIGHQPLATVSSSPGPAISRFLRKSCEVGGGGTEPGGGGQHARPFQPGPMQPGHTQVLMNSQLRG